MNMHKRIGPPRPGEATHWPAWAGEMPPPTFAPDSPATVPPPAGRAPAEDALPAPVLAWVRDALRAPARRLGCTTATSEDAVREAVRRLRERRAPSAWEAFRRDRFGDPAYDDAKTTFLRTIRQVVEEFRQRHAIDRRHSDPAPDVDAAID